MLERAEDKERNKIQEAEKMAEKAFTEAKEIWDAPLTTNDPAIAAALVSIAAELRLVRLKQE